MAEPRVRKAKQAMKGKPSADRILPRQLELEYRVGWLIRLRWLAIVGVALTPDAVRLIGDVEVSRAGVWAVAGFMLLVNVFCSLFRRTMLTVSDPETRLNRTRALAVFQSATDLLALTILLHLSGGIQNPFAAYYIFHVIISAILLSRRSCWVVTAAGALLIVGVDPISLGILRPPGDYGADIVVGEGQPLGNHPNYGGPLLGIFACRGDMRFVRQMPGRIIGMTVDSEGRRAFCMTLQTREQHIRRERATSNVCTNEALCAVAAAVYLSLLGPKGLRRLCEVILSLSHYAMKRLSDLEGVEAPLFRSAHFKEFTVGFRNARVEEVNKALIERGFHGGKPVSEEFPELGEAALYCVTEMHSRRDIDGLVEALREVLGA